MLQELGCLEPLLAVARVPICQARVFVNGDAFSNGRMPTLHGLPSHGLTIPRTVLDEAIFRRAQEAGATTFEDCRVSGYVTSQHGVTVEAQCSGQPARFEATMIVGADGANSLVAKCAGLEMSDPRHVLPAMRAYVDGLSLDHAVLCFERDFFPGYGWIFPIADGLCNIGVGMVQETLLRHGLGLRAFYRCLEEFVQRLGRQQGAEVRIRKSAGWVIKAYSPGRRNHFERGLLIGEAGCFVDPLTGEGIPLALATAGIARKAIVEAFEQGRFDAAGLARYDQRCRAELDADLRIADMVVATARNRDLLDLWMRVLKVMAMTASRDENYMLTLGGIMAGLVPAREGLSPGIIAKSLLHTPGFWMDVWDIRRERPLTDLASGMVSLAAWQARSLRTLTRDPAW
jgi:flavin-dependent dehydrogenase